MINELILISNVINNVLDCIQFIKNCLEKFILKCLMNSSHYIFTLSLCLISSFNLKLNSCIYITTKQFLKNILINWFWQCQLLKILLHFKFNHKKNEHFKWKYFFHWIWHHFYHNFYQNQNESILFSWSWRLIDWQWTE